MRKFRKALLYICIFKAYIRPESGKVLKTKKCKSPILNKKLEITADASIIYADE